MIRALMKRRRLDSNYNGSSKKRFRLRPIRRLKRTRRLRLIRRLKLIKRLKQTRKL
jgi:hypothetical protein